MVMEYQEQYSQHFLDCYPNEGCGFITKEVGFLPALNISTSPQTSFQIAREEFVKVRSQYTIEAVIHSHTIISGVDYGLAKKFDMRTPSSADIATQRALDIPFWIVATDGETVTDKIVYPESPDRELLGRPFIYYINDCYTLMRDWLWQNKQVLIPQHPLEFDWYNGNKGIVKPIYKDWAPWAGFEYIDHYDLEVGDIIVMGIQGDYNHVGVFLKDHKIIQQISDRKSGIYPLRVMESYIQGYARYTGAKTKSQI